MVRLFMLVAATLAAFYFILTTFGDTDGPAGLAQGDASSDEPVIDLARFMPQPGAPEVTVLPIQDSLGGPSESEAVQLAIQAGRDWRAGRTTDRDLIGLVAAVEAPVTTEELQASFWYVSGNTVNLREGPSTSNAVIGRVSLGDAAETLSDTDASWVQIKTENGQTGWISGQFLSPERPG